MRHALALLPLLALPATAQEAPRQVSVELVLLADGSGSIDATERAFQREGYAEAITDPAVLAAIADTLTGSIAVTYVEWATNQAVIAPWTVIDGADSAAAFADAIRTSPARASGSNAIGAALIAGLDLIEGNDIDGLRRVIDFSGDSISNMSGMAIDVARDIVLAEGVTINALPILSPDDPRRAGQDLEALYAAQIVGGPGGFLVTADSRDALADAIRRKLILEIAGLTPDSATTLASAAPRR